MKLGNLLLSTTLCLLITFSLTAQNKDSIAVVNSANRFVTAFNNFDWPTFRASFTDDATIVFPFWDQAKRLRGRQEIEAAWLKGFPEFIDPKNTRKLEITPKDIHIQLYGKTAILTFHLGDGVSRLGRRTLVMVKENEIGRSHTCMLHPLHRTQIDTLVEAIFCSEPGVISLLMRF